MSPDKILIRLSIYSAANLTSPNLSQLGRREMKSVGIGNCEKVSQVLLSF
jgi:hypothetical protein